MTGFRNSSPGLVVLTRRKPKSALRVLSISKAQVPAKASDVIETQSSPCVSAP